MVRTGDTAPDFTVPMAGGQAYNDLESFSLSSALEAGPVVLAFYPAAFTSGCTTEMCTFRDSIGSFERVDAQVYGVSVDLPFAQNIWMQEHDLPFPMLSDWNHTVIHDYDVVLPDMYGSIEVAQRAVFVVNTDGTIVYDWVRDGENPDFEDLVTRVRDAIPTAD